MAPIVLRLCLLCLVFFASTGGAAQLKVYQYTDSRGITSFSDKPPRDGGFKVLWYRCFACGVKNPINFTNTPLFLRQYHQEIIAAASLHQVDSALLRAVIHAESGFNAKALSAKGAIGLMQLMPETAQDLAVQNPWDPKQNIDAGAAYLAKLLQQFDGQLPLALAAYNAGPSVVKRHQGLPPYSETQQYVARVQQLLKRYQSEKTTS